MVEKTLIVFIDGLGYDLVQKSSFSLNLNGSILRQIPALGYSSGILPILWSGEPPERTGRWSEFKYDPAFSPFRWTRFLPLKPLDNPEEMSFSNPLLYFSYGTRIIVRDITARVSSIPFLKIYLVPLSHLRYFSPNHEEIYEVNPLAGYKTLFDIFREQGIRYCYIGYPEVERDLDVYEKSTEAIKEHEVIISCFTQLDSIEHRYGGDSAEVGEKLREVSELVNSLIALFKENNPEGNLIIFSDHGMGNIEKALDVRAAIRKTGLKDGINLLPFYDATMARFWFFDQESERKVREQLKTIKEGRVLEQDELKKFSLNFKDRAFGDLIFLVDQGVVISPNYFQGRGIPKAMHGYDPIYPEQHAFFATDKDIGLKDPIRIEEVFKAMLKIININFTGK